MRAIARSAFILIDRQSNATVAAGTLDFALRRAGNIHWQHMDGQAGAARIKHQQPRCLWFTGLSGAGKSTIANLVEEAAGDGPSTPTCSMATTSPRPQQGPGFTDGTASRTSVASPGWPS